MPVAAWFMLGAGALLAGASLVVILSCRQSLEPLAGLAGLLGMIVCGIGVVWLVETYTRVQVTFAVVILAMGCVIGGYGIVSVLLTIVPGRRIEPVSLQVSSDPVSALAAVILVSSVEPELYRPATVTKDLKELSSQGLPEPSITVTPFLYAAQKARYRAIGGRSPAARQLRAVAELLRLRLDAREFGTIDVVSSVEPGALARSLEVLYSAGYRRAVIAVHEVAESPDDERLKAEVSDLRPDHHGMTVTYTPPMWGSERLADMVARRALSCVLDPALTGVALVMHGQPDALERSHPDYDVQESAFANRVRIALVDEGLTESNVRLCWADWRDPDVTETVRHLAAVGCARILVCPVCYPLESIATVLDFPIAVRQARVEPDVYVTSLAAWGEDPIVVDEIESRVREAAQE